MKNALILHGTGNDSTRNWLPWLKKELERRGYTVWVPDLPHADKPNITTYNRFIFPKWKLNEDSILIGHSSGAVAILGILEQLPETIQVDKAILVAGFTDDLNSDSLKEMFVKPFDYSKIKTRAKKFIFFQFDNDPYVPVWHGEKLQNFLGGELVFMKDQAHFSTTTFPGKKYLQFPELLEKVAE